MCSRCGKVIHQQSEAAASLQAAIQEDVDRILSRSDGGLTGYPPDYRVPPYPPVYESGW